MKAFILLTGMKISASDRRSPGRTAWQCDAAAGWRICSAYRQSGIQRYKVVGAVLLLVNETEKVERENLRREFSANVSHELKTPLTSISGFAEIIEDGLVQEEDITEVCRKDLPGSTETDPACGRYDQDLSA